MPTVRDLTPADAPALTALYGEYDWWADREVEGYGERLLQGVIEHPDLQAVPGLSLLCRRGLIPYYESVGFEVFDRDVGIPEGGSEELVRMIYSRE